MESRIFAIISNLIQDSGLNSFNPNNSQTCQSRKAISASARLFQCWELHPSTLHACWSNCCCTPWPFLTGRIHCGGSVYIHLLNKTIRTCGTTRPNNGGHGTQVEEARGLWLLVRNKPIVQVIGVYQLFTVDLMSIQFCRPVLDNSLWDRIFSKPPKSLEASHDELRTSLNRRSPRWLS